MKAHINKLHGYLQVVLMWSLHSGPKEQPDMAGVSIVKSYFEEAETMCEAQVFFPGWNERGWCAADVYNASFMMRIGFWVATEMDKGLIHLPDFERIKIKRVKATLPLIVKAREGGGLDIDWPEEMK